MFDERIVTDTNSDSGLYIKRHIILHKAECQNFYIIWVLLLSKVNVSL
jgi:hypothetical protein